MSDHQVALSIPKECFETFFSFLRFTWNQEPMLKSNIQIFFSFLKILLAIHHRLKDWPAFNVYVYRFHGNIDCLRKNAKLQSISNVPNPPPHPPRPPHMAPDESIRLGIKRYYRLCLISVLQSGLSFCLKVYKIRKYVKKEIWIAEKGGIYILFMYLFIYLLIYYFLNCKNTIIYIVLAPRQYDTILTLLKLQ